MEFTNPHIAQFFLYLMQGQYDDAVSWPLNKELQITLLNQTSDIQHYSHTMPFSSAVHIRDVTQRVIDQDMAKSGLGFPDFITHKDITTHSLTCQFLKDDCIFIRVCKP